MPALTVVESARVEKLVSWITKNNDHFHNTGKPKVSDEKYDSWKDELRQLVPNHKVLKLVGAPVRAGRLKVTLPYPLASLDKMKLGGIGVESVADMIAKVKASYYIVSNKLDGASILLIYEGGVPVAAYRRGETTEGEEITQMIPHMKIPQTIPYRNRLAVRMEAVIKGKTFDKHLAAKFKTARNLASGIVNKLRGIHSAIEHLDCVAIRLVYPVVEPSRGYAILKKYGFDVVEHSKVKNISERSLETLLKSRRARSHYAMDGLVVEADVKSPLRASNPTTARAFKIPTEVFDTTVLKVEWNPSAHKYMIPTVIIKPIKIDGVTVNRATGFNAKYILDNKIGVGAIIGVMRSGDVIPDIQYVKKPAVKADMPTIAEFGRMKWTPKRVNLVAEHSSISDAKMIARFFVTIKAQGIQEATVNKFVDSGLDSILKICKATPARFAKVEGIQQRSAANIHTSIKQALAKVNLQTLMAASGCFGRGIGVRVLTPLMKKYPNLMKKTNYSARQLENMARSVEGINDRAVQFAEAFPSFVKFYNSLGIKSEVAIVKVVGATFAGKGICFTKFRDQHLQDKIESLGGKMQSGVSRNTSILVVKDESGLSGAKYDSAKALGVVVMTLPKFLSKYKL